MTRTATMAAALLLLTTDITATTAVAAGTVQQESRKPEATSLFGKPLFSPDLAPAQKATLDANLARAQADLAAKPNDPDLIVWVGRRQAYLGRYRESIETFSKGIAQHPKFAALYRHRGHRYITVREFDKAITDFEMAATLIKGQPDAIEPDGAPNASGKPRSTLQSNIWYHLALAYYLTGDFEKARVRYLEGMKVATVNDDMFVAMTDWLYMTYRRLGRDQEAKALLEPIREQMDILENKAYHQRLLMYKGLVKPESLLTVQGATPGTPPDPVQLATQGYGVGNWYLYNKDLPKAKEIFERVTQGTSWGAFGFIAAEADLKRGL
jgi:tetratricopeptide (TPR) repeat protein